MDKNHKEILALLDKIEDGRIRNIRRWLEDILAEAEKMEKELKSAVEKMTGIENEEAFNPDDLSQLKRDLSDGMPCLFSEIWSIEANTRHMEETVRDTVNFYHDNHEGGQKGRNPNSLKYGRNGDEEKPPDSGYV